MTGLETLLREAIRREGSLPFSRFMREALYHPEYGYYRRPRTPFGVSGDFYTAAQLQPVFGILAAAAAAELMGPLAASAPVQLLEVGAGRGEMAPAFSRFACRAVEHGGDWPDPFRGVIFSNELLDALPVDAACFAGGGFRDLHVQWNELQQQFAWLQLPDCQAANRDYLERFGAPREEGFRVEVHHEGRAMIRRMADVLVEGFVVLIDYGYTRREWIRFPRGTLLAYRQHRSWEDVLARPGEQDITAHVPFHVMEETAAECGLRLVRLESLAMFLLAAGEKDQFAAALAGASERERLERRLQLKSLLYGMGETFRVLVLRKEAPKMNSAPGEHPEAEVENR